MGGGKDGRYSSGGIVDEKYEPIINNDIGVKALQNIVDQYKNKWCAPGATEAMWVDTTSNMFSGGIAMAMGWTSSFYGIDDANTSKVAGDIEWAQFPLGKDGATIHSTMPAGINRYGKHPEETYKFLMWLFAPEQDRRESLLGNGPIRPSTYKDPDVMKLGLPKTLGQMLNANSVPQPDLPEFGEMNYNFSLEIAKAATGEKSAKKALDDTAANWREILNKAGYYK